MLSETSFLREEERGRDERLAGMVLLLFWLVSVRYGMVWYGMVRAIPEHTLKRLLLLPKFRVV